MKFQVLRYCGGGTIQELVDAGNNQLLDRSGTFCHRLYVHCAYDMCLSTETFHSSDNVAMGFLLCFKP